MVWRNKKPSLEDGFCLGFCMYKNYRDCELSLLYGFAFKFQAVEVRGIEPPSQGSQSRPCTNKHPHTW